MSDLGTIVAHQTVIPADWLQDLNNLAYRTVAQVYGTGDAATDDAAIQAAINSTGVNGVVMLNGTFASSTAKNLRPQLTILPGRSCVINHTNAATNCFQYIPGGIIGFPGQIKIGGLQIVGPGTPGSGEALGTLTWANIKAGVFIDANAPFCEIYCDIRNFFAGVSLRNAYHSRIGRIVAGCRHGIMIFGESHDTILDNPFVDACTLTGLSVNYGGGQTNNQGTHSASGAYQNTTVGIWLEGCQGFASSGTLYFEGNSMIDIAIGVNDGGAYARTANFTRIGGIGSASPVASPLSMPNGVTKPQGRNIYVSHSVDVTIRGAGFYSGSPTATPNIFVDGACDRTLYELAATVSSNPYEWDDPARVVLQRAGRSNFARDASSGLTYGTHGAATPSGQGPWFGGGFSGRDSIILEALANATDLLFRAKAGQGQIRFADEALNEYFSLDMINGWINAYKHIRLGNAIAVGQNAAIPTIASAATIAPTQMTCVVSGTAAIATITVPSGWPNGGRLTLIPTGLWTTTAAGNIQRAVSAVVNQPIDFIWDGVLTKWWVKT